MPTQVNPECFHQSASSTSAFKRCPTEFRLAYREGLRPSTDTDSQRQGTNWHAMHECYANALNEWLDPDFSQTSHPEGEAAYAMSCVVTLLNEKYAQCPNYKTIAEWKLEQQILLISFVGYQWYFSEDPIEFLASEIAFNLPIHVPKIGLPLPMSQVQRVGKIDHLIRWQGMVGVHERKSTSRSIEPDSDYWDKSKKDTQVSLYALAFRDMREAGLENYGIVGIVPDERFGNTLYDVWHKPTIKPKMLTQADTAKFIETGTYCDNQFEIVEVPHPTDATLMSYAVDGEVVEMEIGKKGFAIRETIAMYGARLLADIYERPEFYYVRREVSRTDAEIRKARVDAYNVYQAEKMMDKAGCWFENENSCRATFACKFIPICYGPGADAVCDGKTTPTGFKRIFVDLTVNGQEMEE